MGERLRRLRVSRGMSLDEVAQAVGCHYSTISAYERGTRNPSQSTLARLAQLYQVSVPFLVCDGTDLAGMLPPEMRELFHVARERTDVAQLALRAAQCRREVVYHIDGLLSFLQSAANPLSGE
ncbi:MAG: helix-turn-helix transcriptional regulator [Bacillota bacterium]|nr:helix-turn-helix transcriptional regulator [Bacillota bacterium]